MTKLKLLLHTFGLVLALSSIAGCGGAPAKLPATPTPASLASALVLPTSTPTFIPPTPTPLLPTVTPTLVPITATPIPALPTYSQVLKTYPKDAQLCCTDAQVLKVTADGEWTFAEGGKICPGRSKLTVGSGGLTTGEVIFGGKWKCYGAKIAVKDAVTIDGKSYEPGTKLTVDKDLDWVKVSSWD